MQRLAPEESTRTATHTAPFIGGLLVLACLAVGAWKSTAYLEIAPTIPVPVEALPGSRTNVRPGMTAPKTPVGVNLGGPAWGELSSTQRDALSPLAGRWPQLSEGQKRHWINLASNFESMSEEEQGKMLSRMTEWANLSAQQRSQARLNYAATSTLSPDDKRAQWEAYQALSEEEKKRLASKAAHKPFGAAVALKPVSPKKLVRIPAATTVAPTQPNPPKIPPLTDYHVPHAYPPAPAPAPATPPVIETAPVQGASAVAAPLPPLNPASAAESEESVDLRDITSVNSPQ
ncbi:DUF3106 domain-containing protein [Diaphorobacter ruginosibacter]|uniref:DUF3106 domain-containing protein n=1 Tax=Diaphorobacter ruginosibacter TaxID=1715720 RepID=A0A7G9RTI4_9BURK|nr:DUF3106 domain-containing protein [Diaphorobacter ruginosibacter]